MGVTVGLQSMIYMPSAQAIPPFPIIDKPPATIVAGAVNTNWLAAGTWQTNTLNPAVENNAGSQINSSLGPQVVGTYTSDGWTRLTDNTPAGGVRSHQAANILNSISFPASTGFEVVFDYRQAGGHKYSSTSPTGDGIAMYLVDASKATTSSGGVTSIASVGAPGNGLGYAATTDSQPEDANGNYPAGMCGLTGGYFGLGLDVFGNYASSSKGNHGGNATLNSSGNYIGLRGSAPAGGCTVGSLPNPPNDYWPWIGGNQTSDKSPIWTGTSGSTTDPAIDPASQYRRVWVEVIPTGTGTTEGETINVYMSPLTLKTATPTSRTLEFTTTATAAEGLAAMPANLMIGFSASTGGSSDYHDIRNVAVTELGDAAITKTVSAGRSVDSNGNQVFGVGDPITFTLDATNNGPTAIGDAPNGVALVYDDLSKLPISNVAWKCTSSGGAACVGTADATGVVNGSGSVVNQQWTAPDGGSVQVTVTGTLTASGNDLTNTAIIPTNFTNYTVDPASTSIQMDSGLSDTNLANNTASVTFSVLAVPQFAITKVADKAQYWVGDPITYTVQVSNTGAASGTAKLTDPVPDGIKVDANGANCVATGTGASCGTASISGNTVTDTVSLPANTSAKLTITGVVTAAGDIENTASVTDTTNGCTQNCQTANASADITATAPTWTITKSTPDLASGVVAPGDVIDYQVTATNWTSANGSGADVPDVVLSDDLSGVLGSATFVPGSAQLVIGSAAAVAEPDPTGTTLTTDPFTLPAGKTAVLTYQVKVDADAWLATLENTVTGTGLVPPQTCDPGTCQTVTHTSGQLFINKEAPDGTPLDGATFQISSDGTGSQSAVITALPVTPVTGQTGEFSVDGIMPGTYWLTETKAPIGYRLLASAISFQVGSTGDVTLVNPTTDSGVASVTGNTITVTDYRSPVTLPAAGGAPAFPIGALGLMILVGLTVTSGAIWLKRQRGWVPRRE